MKYKNLVYLATFLLTYKSIGQYHISCGFTRCRGIVSESVYEDKFALSKTHSDMYYVGFGHTLIKKRIWVEKNISFGLQKLNFLFNNEMLIRQGFFNMNFRTLNYFGGFVNARFSLGYHLNEQLKLSPIINPSLDLNAYYFSMGSKSEHRVMHQDGYNTYDTFDMICKQPKMDVGLGLRNRINLKYLGKPLLSIDLYSSAHLTYISGNYRFANKGPIDPITEPRKGEFSFYYRPYVGFAILVPINSVIFQKVSTRTIQ